MAINLGDQLDLALAWKRLKQEAPLRHFLKLPFEDSLIEVELEEWLQSCQMKIAENQYHPSPVYVCEIPKANGHIRPGAYLLPVDRLMYTAFVGTCFPFVFESIRWSQGIIDHSYPLNKGPKSVDWIKNTFKGWAAFRSQSIYNLRKNFSHVLITDIAGYYENIDIYSLMSDLRQTGAPDAAIQSLSTCLNRWAQVSGRGIPQGYGASDILGKIYLNSVDHHLKAAGFCHLRYVDDIRIFCHSEEEAKTALVHLSRLLRKRGLNVQSAKSKIYVAEKAIAEINGVIPFLQDVIKKYVEEISGDPYFDLFEAEQMLEENPDDAPIEVIERTFEEFFKKGNPAAFDKTLFHFLLKRLGKNKNRIAMQYCEHLLVAHPEETNSILSYFSNLESQVEVQPFLASFLNSKACIYPFQMYQIFVWLSNLGSKPIDDLMVKARGIATDQGLPFFLRSICRKLIGDHGSHADLEILEHIYSDTRDQFEQGEIVCCLSRMEKGRRNSFYSRAERDGELIRRAIKLSKKSGQ